MRSFDQLPDHSRIWIYQAPRPLTLEEQEIASAYLEKFVTEWKAHGTDLDASYSLLHHRFIILAVDETGQNATGCSIDTSVAMIRSLQNEIGVDLLDRSQIAFEDDGLIVSVPMAEFGRMAKEGEVGPDTMVFNNMITELGQWRDGWHVPAEKSWHRRYFSTVK